MISVEEQHVDKITEAFYLILKGRNASLIFLPEDHPDNEIKQAVSYINKFIEEYNKGTELLSRISRGELDFESVSGHSSMLQSLKHLQANLRHLTWKTQRIAGGDFSHHVDFMGDFSVAFNSLAQQLKQSYEQLEHALAESDRLLAEAARYVESLLPRPIENGKLCTDWRFVPSVALGGDSFGYHWLDDDHFAVYLVDVSGHGVSAALLSVTIINVLRSQTLKDTDFTMPDMVLGALNDSFPMDEQDGMYFTIWYGVYDRVSRNLVYSSGGHPPALLFAGPSDSRPEAIPLSTPNMFIGGLAGITFEKATVMLDKPCRLYIFSDGVYEIQGKDGTMWRFNDFVEFMSRTVVEKRSVLDELLSNALKLRPSENLEDDFSILEVLIQ